MKFSGKINDKHVFLADEHERWVATLEKLVGKKVTLDVVLYRNTRSNQQNRYYWGVVVKLFMEHTGIENKRDAHEILKQKILLKTIIVEINGTVTEFEHVESTAAQTTTKFEDYLRLCRQWLSLEHGIYVPLPHECPDESFTFNLY